MRAHTATHLLHAELEKIFPMTKQAWSLVEEDYTRFDFVSDRALSVDEIKAIEESINWLIKWWFPVHVKEHSYDEAIALWAKAFFEEKYADTVRVVTVEWWEWSLVSIELCGGTHVSNTSHIGAFKIVQQEAVAAWTKRIVAVTWPWVTNEMQKITDKLASYANLLDVPVAQLDKKIEKILKEHKSMQESIESLQVKLLSTELEALWGTSNDAFDHVIEIPSALLSIGFKQIVGEAKKHFVNQSLLLRSAEWQFALVSGSDSFSVKERAQTKGLKWGWSDWLFQWKDTTILDH